MDYSPTGSSVDEILQARMLDWVAIFFSRGSSWPSDQTQVSHTAGKLFTIWVTRESMGFSRQEYWSGLPFSSPGDLPDPEIEPRSPALQADSLLAELLGKPGEMWSIHKLQRNCDHFCAWCGLCLNLLPLSSLFPIPWSCWLPHCFIKHDGSHL